MIIAGRVQNQDIICEGGNVKYVHALAEHCNLPNDFADAVTICLLLHECSDAAKSNICQEAWRILKHSWSAQIGRIIQNGGDVFLLVTNK